MRFVVGDSTDLHDFVVEQENRDKKTLGEEILIQIMKGIVNGECKITGSQTDHERAMMWIEFTWEWKKEEPDASEG